MDTGPVRWIRQRPHLKRADLSARRCSQRHDADAADRRSASTIDDRFGVGIEQHDDEPRLLRRHPASAQCLLRPQPETLAAAKPCQKLAARAASMPAPSGDALAVRAVLAEIATSAGARPIRLDPVPQTMRQRRPAVPSGRAPETGRCAAATGGSARQQSDRRRSSKSARSGSSMRPNTYSPACTSQIVEVVDAVGHAMQSLSAVSASPDPRLRRADGHAPSRRDLAMRITRDIRQQQALPLLAIDGLETVPQSTVGREPVESIRRSPRCWS